MIFVSPGVTADLGPPARVHLRAAAALQRVNGLQLETRWLLSFASAMNYEGGVKDESD